MSMDRHVWLHEARAVLAEASHGQARTRCLGRHPTGVWEEDRISARGRVSATGSVDRKPRLEQYPSPPPRGMRSTVALTQRGRCFRPRCVPSPHCNAEETPGSSSALQCGKLTQRGRKQRPRCVRATVDRIREAVGRECSSRGLQFHRRCPSPIRGPSPICGLPPHPGRVPPEAAGPRLAMRALARTARAS